MRTKIMGGGRTHFEKTDWTSMDSLNQGEEEESYANEMGAGEGGGAGQGVI